MTKRGVVALLVVVPLLVAFTTGWTNTLWWGYDGMSRAKEWVSPDGRLDIQSQMPDTSTAWDCWPTANAKKPTAHSLCELTLNRYQWDDARMERLNISAMVDQSIGGAYRIGVERGGTGIHRPIIFCFEDVTPGVAVCPMKIDPTGVYVLTNGAYARMGGG